MKAFVTFLFRPTLEVRKSEAISTRALTLWLLLFSFVATALFAILAAPLIFLTNTAPSEGLRGVLNQPPISVILTVVMIGPLVEEAIFRGWLTGTARAFAASALSLAILFGGSWLLTAYLPQAAGPGLLAGLAAAGLFAFIATDRGKRQNPAAWYRAAFPYIFWAQGLLFGGLHYVNVASTSSVLPLLTTAPLILCGWLWGYARITLGFGTAWLLHMAYNLPVVLATIVLSN